jgi:Bacterial RNA polymerase, alpha chain C terminal domain
MTFENPQDAPALPIEALGDSAHCAATIEALCGLHVAPREALAVIEYARGWALDCDWQDGADIAGMPNGALLAGAHRAYDGGMRQIVIDCRASACDCGALDIEHTGGKCPQALDIAAVGIEEIELGVRAYNVCKRAGIHTLGALAAVTAEDAARWARDSDGRLTLGANGWAQIIEAQSQIADWQAREDAAAIEAIEDGAEDADYAHTLALTTAPLDCERFTAIYRAPIAPDSDRSIFEQTVTASDWREALDIADREASSRGLAVVALAAGAPDGFGAAILAAGLALD